MTVQTALCYLQLARKDGATPLHEAAAAGHTEVAKVLMSVGATPDVTDVVSRPRQVIPCLLCVQQNILSTSSLIQMSTEVNQEFKQACMIPCWVAVLC